MRVLAFILLLILSTLVPWYLLLVCALAYALYFQGAVELLVLAALIDAYFGAHASVPLYTLAAIPLLLVVEWIKTRLVIYNET